ncbi:MAG: IS256 family transposase, partial [gamma proteobacterium symbiont of Ctena orbiculata]
AIQEASRKWTMPIRNWKTALNRFMIEFEDRLADYV